MKISILSLLLITTTVGLITSCGQTGPLYLPAPKALPASSAL